jgi:ribonucleoside-diphosphate reductase alpha chain
MMDAATTGVEPDIALTKTKLMVGGSSMTYTNPNVTQGLKCLGYPEKQIEELANFLKKNGHFEGSVLKEEHLSVFDCAAPVGSRKISVDGHIDMVAAIQPFLSGAISKTFNMPHNATVKDVERTFLKAWESGVKCITVYREGSKLSEPLRVREIKEETLKKNVLQRRKLPADLLSFRHGFSVGGHKGFIHIGHDPETEDPVEIFIRVAHYGATAGGLLDSYGILFSKALQFGIPMEELIQHMIGSKFPPAGVTSNSKIPMAGSIMDYIAKYLKIKYLNDSPEIVEQPSIPPMSDDDFDLSEDMCPVCGAFLHRTGTCTQCPNCGHSTGICG